MRPILLNGLVVLSVLLLVGCGPTYSVSRYNDSVTVSHEYNSCFTADDYWVRANQECQKVGKVASRTPNGVTGTSNRFCSSTGVANASFTCIASVDSSKPDVSRIELRALQTRKFNKSPREVASAINELYKDKNQRCSNVKPPHYACETGISMTRPVGGKNTTYCADPDGKQSANQQIIKRADLSPDGHCFGGGYDVSFSFETNYPKSTWTILRIRIVEVSTQKQITDPKAYQRVFKEIADGLFINAIELTPAEMQ